MRNESIFNYTLTLGMGFVCLLFGACSVPASGNAADDLQLGVQMTIGEDSKDSSMQTTTISIEPHSNTVVWRRSVDGGERMFIKIFPSHEEYKLSPADRRKLITLIESGHLLTNDSIKLSPDIDYPPTHQYFDISFASTLNGKSGAFSISGPRNAVQVKEEKLYQNLIALVKEIYRIIKSQGGSVVFEELLTPKRTRPAVTQPPTASNDNLTLRVEVTTGEHSMDSNSQTTHVTVGPNNKIIASEDVSGGGIPITAPVHHEYQLSSADKSKLIAMLRSGQLLKPRSIEIPRDPASHHYFAILIEGSLGSRGASSIRITASRTAVQLEKEKLYQNSLELIKELYRIIKDQGGSLALPTLIVPKRPPPVN